MTLQIRVLLVALVIVGARSNARAQQAFCSPDVLGSGIEQISANWCFAANLQYLGDYFGCGWTRCNLVWFFLDRTGGGPYYCCSTTQCHHYAPTIPELQAGMVDFGFLTVGQSAALYNPPLPGHMEFLLCDNDVFMLGIFGILGGTPAAPITSGHAATLASMDTQGAPSGATLVKVMDSEDGDHKAIAYTFLLSGIGSPVTNGAWDGYIGVTGVNCPSTPIGDLLAFAFSGFTPEGYVKLSMTFAAWTDPSGNADLYISEDPMGPARLVDSFGPLATMPTEPITVMYIDEHRIDQSAVYYYFLAFDEYVPHFMPLPDARVRANSANPIGVSGAQPRDTLGAPTNVQVVDAPYEKGKAVNVAWSLSANDSDADYYNIFRSTLPGFDGMHYLASVPRGTSSFTDENALVNHIHNYVVATAHHGFTAQTGYGNLGLFNDRAGEVGVLVVDEFATVDATLLSADSLLGAPSGTEESLVVEVVVTDSGGQPTVGVPIDVLYLNVGADSAYVCAGDSIAPDSVTSAAGRTSFTMSAFGGHDDLVLHPGLREGYWLFQGATAHVRSPDGNYDGLVDLVDFSLFGPTYPSLCGDENYDRKWDLNFDCEIDIIDFSVIGNNFLTGCPE